MSLTTLDIQSLRTGWVGTNFSVNIGATATSRLSASTFVALSSDVSYCLNIAGTAATTDFRIPANVVLFVLVDKKTVGCISATGGNGTLYISEAV